MMQYKSAPKAEPQYSKNSKQRAAAPVSSHSEHYYPAPKQNDQAHPVKNSYFAAPNISSAKGNASPVVQRYFIVGNADLTKAYHDSKRSNPFLAEMQLNTSVTEIFKQMLQELVIKKNLSTNPEEIRYLDHVIQSIQKDEGGLLRRQMKKWIRDDVGDKSFSKNKVFGQKFQPRAYSNYYDAAIALVGWVDAKEGRRQEKYIAQEVLQDRAINYHLDSVFLRIRAFIIASPIKDEILNELQNPNLAVKVRHAKITAPQQWNLYKSYYDRGANPQHTLPRHLDVLGNPGLYDIRQKTGVLHDLMHYFLEKYGDVGLFYGLPGLPDFQATTLSGRKPYTRPKNSQITGNMAEVKAGRAQLNPANVVYSDEEQSDSYKFARRNNLPMYGRHSYSAARMMGMAKQVGAKPEEVSAVSWAIMAYWRIHYDHTNIPYHTTHEIMDFTPEFGLDYDPKKRFDGFRTLQGQHFLDFLTRNAHEDPRAAGTLMFYLNTHFNRACYLLMHPELWDIPAIMFYLKTTFLPDEEFLRLPAGRLRAFFNYNIETQKLFHRLPKNRKDYVLGRTYISMSNQF